MNRIQLFEKRDYIVAKVRDHFNVIQNPIVPTTEYIQSFVDDDVIRILGQYYREVLEYLVAVGLANRTVSLQDAARLTGLTLPELIRMRDEQKTSQEVVPPYDDDDIPF